MSELYRQCLSLDLCDEGRDGGLGCGGDRGKTRPAGGEAARDAHHLQLLLELPSHVVAEAIGEQQDFAGLCRDGLLSCRGWQASPGDGVLQTQTGSFAVGE